jgi:8-oxo-dGTP diphosphatase
MGKFTGVLLVCENTGRFMLLQRSNKISYSGVWGLMSGGVEEGETPLEAVKRELMEETKINPEEIDFKLFETQYEMGYPFSFFLGYCEKEYVPELDYENKAYGWYNMTNLPKPLFPTLYSSLVRIF